MEDEKKIQVRIHRFGELHLDLVHFEGNYTKFCSSVGRHCDMVVEEEKKEEASGSSSGSGCFEQEQARFQNLDLCDVVAVASLKNKVPAI
ncbi:hypothetical protein RYX36_024818 [Vicia faba]